MSFASIQSNGSLRVYNNNDQNKCSRQVIVVILKMPI